MEQGLEQYGYVEEPTFFQDALSPENEAGHAGDIDAPVLDFENTFDYGLGIPDEFDAAMNRFLNRLEREEPYEEIRAMEAKIEAEKAEKKAREKEEREALKAQKTQQEAKDAKCKGQDKDDESKDQDAEM